MRRLFLHQRLLVVLRDELVGAVGFQFSLVAAGTEASLIFNLTSAWGYGIILTSLEAARLRD